MQRLGVKSSTIIFFMIENESGAIISISYEIYQYLCRQEIVSVESTFLSQPCLEMEKFYFKENEPIRPENYKKVCF